MSPEKWQRVKALFDAALDQKQAERGIFLARSCPDDADVREEVLRLLSERDSMESSFLSPSGTQTLLDRAARSVASRAALSYEGELLDGRYFVEEEIGRGGNGVVYRALDRQLHSRPVVVKFLHAIWDDHERVRIKFNQEIEALSRLHHPSIVGVLDVGHAPDGRLFLAMEYVDGTNLRSRLQNGPLEFSEAAAIVTTICDALDSAHKSGILHRDLKPENIMLMHSGGAAKLIDFGVAKVQDSGYDARTETITVVGTVQYVAPEQLMGRAGLRSDLYALGVVCYEMLTGHPPFQPETPFHLYELQKSGRITPPSKVRPGIPEAADRAILRSLSFHPEDRQASAGEFAAEFRAKSKPGLGQNPRRFLPWAAAAMLLVTAAGTGWRLTERWGRYESRIEFEGGRDPEEFGFQSHLDLIEHAVRNRERTGYDAIRLLSKDQGYYYRKLTRAQAYAAVRKGWKIEVIMKPVQGAGGTGIDLTPAGGRYDVEVMLNASRRQVVLLTTQIAKGMDGPSYEIEGPEDAFHEYQLIFDPNSRSARLLVDGLERLSDYRGHKEYREGWGLTFGAFTYKSEQGEAVFKRVRFEINSGTGYTTAKISGQAQGALR
jgi:predicted Ser/Thr protein kinase